jgi:hypothetical protein
VRPVFAVAAAALWLTGCVLGAWHLDDVARTLSGWAGADPTVMTVLGWSPFGGLAVLTGVVALRAEARPRLAERICWAVVLYVGTCAAVVCLGGRTTASRAWVAAQVAEGGPSFRAGMTAGLIAITVSLVAVPFAWSGLRAARRSDPPLGHVFGAALLAPPLVALAVVLAV